MKHLKISSLLLILISSLTACTGLFDKDNTPPPTPLTSFTPESHAHLLFSVKMGEGVNKDYLKLKPAIDNHAIYTTSTNGVVASANKLNGHLNWQVNTALPLTAGPGVGDGLVVVGSRRGEVVALNLQNGSKLWISTVQGEILASPAISNQQVIVKTTDGTVYALSTKDGRLRWTYQQAEPNLILRGSSNPHIVNGFVFAGFANGSLAKIGLYHGQAYWLRSIATPEGAFAIQRMIDIDADPVFLAHRVFAATYQGRIASLNFESGDILWTHELSSYTGMTGNTDSLYVSDAKSYVWSFGINDGLVNWRQTQLAARHVTAPALMGRYLVLADAEGYAHWLDTRDGHFAAREFLGAAVYAAPLVENGIVYFYTSNGSLLAYRLS